MHRRRRQQIMTVFAVVATLAIAAKIYKAYWRGETTQSRVKPLN
jgi:hypothetical protein